MGFGLQNVLVAMIILACAFYVARQGIGALFGRKSRLGCCCARGCPLHGKCAAATKPSEDSICSINPKRHLQLFPGDGK
jgi:hypothetical protein